MYDFFVKFSDNSNSIDIQIAGDETIGALKKAIIDNKELPPNTRLRLVWRGDELSNDSQTINVRNLSFRNSKMGKRLSFEKNAKITIHAVVIKPNNDLNPSVTNENFRRNGQQQGVDPNHLLIIRNDNHPSFSAELCEFFFTPGWTLLTNIGGSI